MKIIVAALAGVLLLGACTTEAEWKAWGDARCANHGGFSGETVNQGKPFGSHSVAAVCNDEARI